MKFQLFISRSQCLTVFQNQWCRTNELRTIKNSAVLHIRLINEKLISWNFVKIPHFQLFFTTKEHLNWFDEKKINHQSIWQKIAIMNYLLIPLLQLLQLISRKIKKITFSQKNLWIRLTLQVQNNFTNYFLRQCIFRFSATCNVLLFFFGKRTIKTWANV